MTDWNKLKVVDLKAELKRRGLVQTGLKPALVARLTSAENEDGEESEATLQGDGAKQDASSATSPDTVSPVQQTSGLSAEKPQDAPTQEPQISTDGPAEESIPPLAIVEKPLISTDRTTEESVPLPATIENTLNRESRTESILAVPSTTIEPSTQEPPSHHSTLPSVEPQEAREDGQKRKRRSQSPPPTATDSARKRARQDGGASGPETDISDIQMQETNNERANTDDKRAVSEGPLPVSMPADETMKEQTPPASDLNDTAVDGMDVDTDEQSRAKSAIFEPSDSSPSRPRASKYKDLFTAQQRRPSIEKPAPRDAPDPMETETDRIIAPAIHPATASLYIRDFMRPLNENQLKVYLADLATAPGQDTDLDVISNFYVDQIRTHAFISFTNVSAASRVRSAVHDRKWPEETTRKPLWADFVPVDKVEGWIQEELSTKGGGRPQAKRWEVYYDVDEDRNVTTSLQESSNMPRPQAPARQPSIPVPTSAAPFQSKGSGRGTFGTSIGSC